MLISPKHFSGRFGLLATFMLVAIGIAAFALFHRAAKSEYQYTNFRQVDAAGHPLPRYSHGDLVRRFEIGKSLTYMPRAAAEIHVTENDGSTWTDGKRTIRLTKSGPVGNVDMPADATGTLKFLDHAFEPNSGDSSTQPAGTFAGTTISPAMLQKAYVNYVYNKTCKPAAKVTDDLVDDAFGKWIDRHRNVKLADLFGPDNGQLSVTTTVYGGRIAFHTFSDKWRSGRLITTTAPGKLTVPGNDYNQYVWHYAWL